MASIYTIPLKTNQGEDTTLEQYKGKILYIVNVASKCGLTKQYAKLVEMQDKYADDVVVLGFPANDFHGQEPGENADIYEFCQLNYKVNFPLFAKGSVIGPKKQPLYAELVKLQPVCAKRDETVQDLLQYDISSDPDGSEVVWNFEKFIINRDGTVAARFAPNILPDAEEVVAAIEQFKA